MEGSTVVAETTSQKKTCVMLVSDLDRRIYLAWVCIPYLDPKLVSVTYIDIKDPFPYEKWFELLFQSVMRATEIEVHVLGKVPPSWTEYICQQYGWVHVSYGVEPEVQGAHGDGNELAVTTLMHLLEADCASFKRTFEPFQGMLSVDSNSMNDLGIITRAPGSSSIFSLAISQCMTSQGKKCMKDWFMFPMVPDSVRASRLDMIQAFISNRHVMSSARNILKRIGNPCALLETLWKNQTLWSACHQTRNFIKFRDALESLIKLYEVCNFSDGCTGLSCLSHNTAVIVQQIGSLIDEIVDQEQLQEGMCVHYGVSQELDALKSTHFGMDTMMKQLVMLEKERVPKYLRANSGTFSWEMIHIHQVGVYIHCMTGLLPFYLEEYLPDWSLAFEPGSLQEYHGALYSTDSCMQVYQRFGSVFQSILDLEAAICTKLTDKILKQKNVLQNAFYVIANLDCILALAKFSVDQNMTRPEHSAEGQFQIQGGWNPILQCNSDTSNCIPNDTVVQGERKTHIIIGKGGTGKSVYLQQVSIIVFLAHIGCYVPAKHACIPTSIDRIFCMLSTQESLHDSSFSYSLGKVLEMLQLGTHTSLFLIESFGKATVSSDGIALAAAVIKYISNKRGIFMFATHMGQLLLDQLHSLEGMYDLYYCASLPGTTTMSNQTRLFKIMSGKETKDQELDCSILCQACPLVVERARQVLDLSVSTSSQSPLKRHPGFSILEKLTRIESVKNIRSMADAIRFIED